MCPLGISKCQSGAYGRLSVAVQMNTIFCIYHVITLGAQTHRKHSH